MDTKFIVSLKPVSDWLPLYLPPYRRVWSSFLWLFSFCLNLSVKCNVTEPIFLSQMKCVVNFLYVCVKTNSLLQWNLDDFDLVFVFVGCICKALSLLGASLIEGFCIKGNEAIVTLFLLSTSAELLITSSFFFFFLDSVFLFFCVLCLTCRYRTYCIWNISHF